VDVPPIATPDKATVLVVGQDPPFGWLVPFFPESVSFAGVANNLPAAADYQKAVRDLATARGGPIYAILPTASAGRAETVAGWNDWFDRTGMTSSKTGCAVLSKVVPLLWFKPKVVSADGEHLCRLALRPKDEVDVVAANEALRHKASEALLADGFALADQECQTYSARISRRDERYQWCPVTLAKPA
jgi:hypothetical protein